MQYLILLVGCGMVGEQCLDDCAGARLGGLVQCCGPLLICSVHIGSMLQQSFQQRDQLSCRLACTTTSCTGDADCQHHDADRLLE